MDQYWTEINNRLGYLRSEILECSQRQFHQQITEGWPPSEERPGGYKLNAPSLATVRNYEDAKKKPADTFYVEQVCRIFNARFQWIMAGEGEPLKVEQKKEERRRRHEKEIRNAVYGPGYQVLEALGWEDHQPLRNAILTALLEADLTVQEQEGAPEWSDGLLAFGEAFFGAPFEVEPSDWIRRPEELSDPEVHMLTSYLTGLFFLLFKPFFVR